MATYSKGRVQIVKIHIRPMVVEAGVRIELLARLCGGATVGVHEQHPNFFSTSLELFFDVDIPQNKILAEWMQYIISRGQISAACVARLVCLPFVRGGGP